MIGRTEELKTLRDCIAADRSRLVVVYGRRRVGKTFLVREAFDYRFTFTHTGLEDGDYAEQLNAFWRALKSQWNEGCERPRDWMEAFESLKKALASSGDARKTVFIDELPWMDTRNSGFVKAVEAFWNGWASARKDVVMVVCGSAASWMSEKILQNRGGLFNRANRTIYLEPFTLRECEEFLDAEGIPMDRKEIVSAYMAFGGAPYYWSLLERGRSLSQNLDRLFFAPGAELAKEFSRLYKSVFAKPEPYVDIVTALMLILLAPLLFWFQRRKKLYFAHCWKVLIGQKSWVGTRGKETRPGIFGPEHALSAHPKHLSAELKQRLQLRYLRNYKLSTDLQILTKNIFNI